MVLRGLRAHYRRGRSTRKMHEVWIGETRAGPGCAGHVVQFGVVAVFDAGMAGEDTGFSEVLPDKFADYRVRHFAFLGGADGDAGDSLYGASSLSRGVSALAGADDERGEDVEVEGDGT